MDKCFGGIPVYPVHAEAVLFDNPVMCDMDQVSCIIPFLKCKVSTLSGEAAHCENT